MSKELLAKVVRKNQDEIYIEHLQAKNKQLKKAIEDFGNNPAGFDWAVLERIEQLQAENKRLKEENRWIPVSEGLPEKTDVYLVLPHNKHCPTLWYQNGWFWYDEQDDAISNTIGHNSDVPIPKVTHYKPIILPKEANGKENQ